MGRKKIEIKFIENKKERAVTFCKRKHGLLKKAAELATLCGVKVCLLFTDLVDSMHYFSNEPEMKIEYEGTNKRKREQAYLYTYSLDDYPFNVVLDSQKKDVREGERSYEPSRFGELLAKRKPLTDLKIERDRHIDKVAATNKKISIPNYLYIPTTEKKFVDQSEAEHRSVHSQGSTAFLKGLDADQSRSVEFFMAEIDGMITEISSKNNRDPRRDEDLIILLTLKEFVSRYFQSPAEPSLSTDNIARMMRSKITVNEMIMVLSSIKFKDKNPDMILVTIKQFNDIFLELIINPSGFKSNQISFFRGGKSIINIFIFLIKNYFQQIRIMKSIYIEDSIQSETAYLFHDENIIDILKTMIVASLELSAIDSTCQVIPNNNTSAFQLHSQRHSLEHQDKFEHHESDALAVSGNILDKAMFGNSLIVKSHMSKSKREPYSFELGQEFMASGRLSPIRDEPRDFEPATSNLNMMVSNLLKKKSK